MEERSVSVLLACVILDCVSRSERKFGKVGAGLSDCLQLRDGVCGARPSCLFSETEHSADKIIRKRIPKTTNFL